MKKTLLLIALALTLLSTPALADTEICACEPKYLDVEAQMRGELTCSSTTRVRMSTTMQEMIEKGWKLVNVIYKGGTYNDIVFYFKK